MGKDERFSEMQEEDRRVTRLQERKKNSNERELERYQEEERQKQIKEELEMFRKQKKDELWRTNIFAGHKSILANDNPIITGKNIFKVKRKRRQQGLFFK